MITNFYDTNLTPEQNSFEELDMMGLSDAELLKLMTPEKIKEMKDYLASKTKK